MKISIYLYIIFTMFAAFGLSSLNFEKIIKKNKIIETRILYFLLSFALGYLVTKLFLVFLPEGI